jgi:hypothetical protein
MITMTASDLLELLESFPEEPDKWNGETMQEGTLRKMYEALSNKSEDEDLFELDSMFGADMRFAAALTLMERGWSVTRRAWPKGRYVSVHEPHYVLLGEDIHADDWVVFQSR